MPLPKLASTEECTGCAACANICASDAIEMRENQWGFLEPVINKTICNQCGLCEAVCPVLHPVFENLPEPTCYAVRAEDAIREKSSSGGAFSLFANHILQEKGWVAGAVFDQSWQARFALTNCADGIALMRGSKYVQARIVRLYRKIRELLKSGQKVLFTGTPCQVAGLKAFLQKPYDNLYTCETVCHGVPSQKHFNMCVAEIARGRKIKNICFRDKKQGWYNQNLKIEFSNGDHYPTDDIDHYIKNYLTHLLQRPACMNCKFAGFNRQGDITIGDFWGISKLIENYLDECGTSLLLLNNRMGEELWDCVSQHCAFKEHINSNEYRQYNRFWHKLKDNPNRRRFFDLTCNHSFKSSVELSTSGHFDIGLVGPHTNRNIGGFLTYYALYHVLEDLGYSTLLIDFPRKSPWGNYSRDMSSFADSELYPPYAVAKTYDTLKDMAELNKICDQFVVGSDQIFKPDFFLGWGKVFQLDWVDDGKKKIAYSSSMGKNGFDCPEDIRLEMAYNLGKFDAFSVREQEGVAICEKYLGLRATQVADPVFLCDSRHYDCLANAARDKAPSEKFLNAYFFEAIPDKQGIIELICKEKNLARRIYQDRLYKENLLGNVINEATINTRIRDMRDCSWVATDSFHGLCFAIYFKKDFIVMPNVDKADSRLLTLLNDIGLTERYVMDWDDFNNKKQILFEKINYEAVYATLNPIIERSKSWLKNNLRKTKSANINTAVAFLEHKFALLEDEFHDFAKLQRDQLKLLAEKIEIISNK